jgi:hypothetical protein
MPRKNNTATARAIAVEWILTGQNDPERLAASWFNSVLLQLLVHGFSLCAAFGLGSPRLVLAKIGTCP